VRRLNLRRHRADTLGVNEHDSNHDPVYSGDNRALGDWLIGQVAKLVDRRLAIESAASGLSEIELAAHRRSLHADWARLHDELVRGMAARGIRAAA
jgi:hypothetical protein